MVEKSENKILMENEFLKREVIIGNGATTSFYNLRPEGAQRGNIWYPVIWPASKSPFEACVRINGVHYELNCKNTAFQVKEVVTRETDDYEFVTIKTMACHEAIAGINLDVCYQISKRFSFLAKWAEVSNASSVPYVIENVTVDILNLAPKKVELTVFTDYYWDVMVHDGYYNLDRIEFPENINRQLMPGETVRTFRSYQAVTSSDRDESSVILERIYKEIAPWIKNTYIKQLVQDCKTYEELMEVADHAAECGFEVVSFFFTQLWTNIGDYIPRPDLFPHGKEDLIRLIEYYHSKGLKVMPYCSTTIAWDRDEDLCHRPGEEPWLKIRQSKVHREHPEWQYLGPNGKRYLPEAFGNMCYQTPWGDYIKEKLFELIDVYHFDGLDIDGPYHGLPCLDPTHKHGENQSVRFMNWEWEKQFYQEVIDKGAFIAAPQEISGFFCGVAQRPAGYREEEFLVMGGMPLIVQNRSFLYDARYSVPASGAFAFTSIDIYHKYSIEADENDITTYHHAMGTMFGYGYAGQIKGTQLYKGPKTKEDLIQWVKFYKKYRDVLGGEMLHLSKPNHFDVDAVVHVNPKANVPALLMAFNPTGEEKRAVYSFSLKAAGFAPNQYVLFNGEKIRLDSAARCAVSLCLQGYEIAALPINSWEAST